MKKVFTCKCIFFTFFSLSSSSFAGELKSYNIRALGGLPTVKNVQSHNKHLLNDITSLIGNDVDLTLFDKHKKGWSIYGRVSKVSRLGLRYNY